MTRIKWSSVAVLILLLAVIALLVIIRLQSSAKKRLIQQNTTLTQEKSEAQMITSSVIATTNLFNDIARATQNDQQTAREDSEKRIVVIREAFKADECAARPVPADAVNSLRNHRNQIRSGASSGNTGKPAD